jgi:hypothetical protein
MIIGFSIKQIVLQLQVFSIILHQLQVERHLQLLDQLVSHLIKNFTQVIHGVGMRVKYLKDI